MIMQRRKSWRCNALLLCCLGVLSGAAAAQASRPGFDWGNYIGAAAGVPEFGDLGLKVFGGQQLHPYFGWEAALTRLVREVETRLFGDVRSDFWGLSGAAVGILPFSKEFSGFGKLGAMAGRKKVSGPGGDNSDSEFNLLIGIGARFALTPRAAIRAEYEDFH